MGTVYAGWHTPQAAYGDETPHIEREHVIILDLQMEDKPVEPRKAKRQSSFSGIGNSNGIMVKSNNLSNANHNNTMTTPKLYPKAIANEYDSMGTLRRHSNQPNNKSNIDIEEDKFY